METLLFFKFTLFLIKREIVLNLFPVAVSAAVTAYARIHMSQFKLMQDLTLYYTDTDSIDIERPKKQNRCW
jgi:hypothetical protein